MFKDVTMDDLDVLLKYWDIYQKDDLYKQFPQICLQKFDGPYNNDISYHKYIKQN